MSIADGYMSVWVIYKDPTDYPGQYVTREQRITRDGRLQMMPEPAYVGDSLDGARAVVPPGDIRIDRQTKDDPTILETWL